MGITRDQFASLMADAVGLFPSGKLKAGPDYWTATVGSQAFTSDFGSGGTWETYDLTLTAIKPDGAADLKIAQRIIWNNSPYTISRIENVMDGSCYVIGLSRGSAPRG